MLAGTTFQEVLVLLGVTRNTCDNPQKSFFLFQTTINSFSFYGSTISKISEPKFLGLIGYQISLAMELRWRALPAGSAIKHNMPKNSFKHTHDF